MGSNLMLMFDNQAYENWRGCYEADQYSFFGTKARELIWTVAPRLLASIYITKEKNFWGHWKKRW